jgi:putative acyl-CoA dehydrogenase
MVAEALEVLGGNGYAEESGMPRLYREAPLNGIWEGSGNVICLDVLRAAAREEGTLEALVAEIKLGSGDRPEVESACNEALAAIADPESAQANARFAVERLALALQASLLSRFAPDQVADAFIATRIRGEGGRAFGSLRQGVDVAFLTARATPHLG